MGITSEEAQKVCDQLTIRERHFAALAAMGKTTSQIAQDLGIQVATASRQSESLRQKLKVVDHLNLALFVVRNPKLERLLRDSLKVPPKRGRGRSAQTAVPLCDNDP